jgi:tetratricopeptide (TPR) repeat protein
MWVASQFMALGAGPGQQGAAITQVVSKDQRKDFLTKAADKYESLLKSDDQKIKDSELSIRLRLAAVYRELEKWDEALGHLEWIVRQPKGANMLSAQWEAATFLGAAGAAEKDKAKAVDYLKQAVMGRQGEVVFWGWSGLANKLQKQAFAGGSNEKAAESRRRFFEARLNVPKTRLKRAEVGDAADRTKQLEMAEKDIMFTHKLYPDMGGKEFRGQFDKLLEDIQKQLDRPSKRGVDDLDQELQAEQVQKPAE